MTKLFIGPVLGCRPTLWVSSAHISPQDSRRSRRRERINGRVVARSL